MPSIHTEPLGEVRLELKANGNPAEQAATRRVLSSILLPGVLLCLVAMRTTALGQSGTGAIAHWAFDEGSGTTALDSSSNNNVGTIIGAAYVPGHSNTALSFNGSNNYVFTPDTQSGGTTGSGLDMGARDWTVGAWVNTTASGM